MKSLFATRLGLLTAFAGSAVALVVSCGDSSTTNPTADMSVAPDLSAPAADMSAPVTTITSLSKNSDFTKGGTSITINGANFRPGAIVKFGTLTVPATDTMVSADGNSIIVKVPPNTGKPGKVDITVTNTDGTSVTSAKAFNYYLENVTFGNPTVISGTGLGPRAVYVVDLDGKNGIDLLVVNADGKSVSTFLNNPVGTFTMKATTTLAATCVYPYSAAVADVNGDTKLDVLLPCQNSTNEADYLQGNGDGTFATAAKITLTNANKPQAIVATDLSGDNLVDMLVASNGTNTNNVYTYLGAGNGTFAPLMQAMQPASTLNSVYNIKAFDFNADGKPDVIVSGYMLGNTVPNAAVLKVGTTTPTTLTTMGANVYDFAAADYDNDGKMDLVFANEGSNTFSLFVQGANNAFTLKNAPVATSTGGAIDPQAIAAADIDGDGNADVLTANYGATTGDIALFKGTGNGSFGSRVTIGTGSSVTNGRPNSIVVADLNGDGRLDIATTNYLAAGGQLVVLFNTGS